MTMNREWKLVLSAIAVTLLLVRASSAPVRAPDIQCTGTLGAIHVNNLRVPQNASCNLSGTLVDGNISVETNATLYAYEVHVNHDIQTDKAARVNVYTGSFVGGNIKIVRSGAADIQSANIGNDLSFNENNQALNAANNIIGGNLQASKNTAGVSINGNNINTNLQCKDNLPPPAGAGNIVGGKMEGQCVDFDVLPTPVPTDTPPATTITPPPETGTPVVATNTPSAPTQTPTIDNEPPSVQWIAPVPDGERFNLREGEQVQLEVEAQDNEGIRQVAFIRWDAVNLKYIYIGTLTQAPYHTDINASTLNPEWNQVFAVASDPAGNQSGHPSIWLYKIVEGKMSSLTFIFLPMIGK
jgi:hypothetical protein